MFIAFSYGFLLAFSLIIPLGPQNMFIFSEGSRAKRFYQVLPVVITAALCDTLLIVLAILGVGTKLFYYPYVKTIMVLGGVIFLLYMGWQSLQAARIKRPEDLTVTMPVERRILYILAFSLLNPHAIIDTVVVIGSGALSYHGVAKIAYAGACIGVSWLWFLVLAFLGKIMANVRNFRVKLNYASAIIMWLCALLLLKTNFG